MGNRAAVKEKARRHPPKLYLPFKALLVSSGEECMSPLEGCAWRQGPARGSELQVAMANMAMLGTLTKERNQHVVVGRKLVRYDLITAAPN